MSGHSKWNTIKRKKAATDSRRGQLFGRLIREITVAAKSGGSDIEANPRLRTAVATAKTANMPQDNITRAIQRGTGELPGVVYDEVVYGGFGPGGVAVLIETMTDNRNRTTPEIRHVFSKCGGNLAETSSVLHMFERKGYVVVEQVAVDEDSLMEIILDAGAEDMRTEEGGYEITTDTKDFDSVVKALSEKEIPTLEAQIAMLPVNTVKVEGRQAQQVLKMMDMFDELDDVQNIWSNFDIDAEEIQS